MYRYANKEGSVIERVTDGAFIPACPGNADFDAIVDRSAPIAAFLPYAGSVEAARQDVLTRIRDRASQIILTRYTLAAQLNAAARGIELVEAKLSRPLTDAEANEEAAIRSMYAWIKEVRACCAAKVATVESLADINMLLVFDAENGWPT